MASGSMRSLRRMANDLAELPGIRFFAKAYYNWLFTRDVLPGNIYCGVYKSMQEARSGAPRTFPTSFETVPGDIYENRRDSIRIVDYPVLFWLERLFSAGHSRIFDLGGNVGVSYYGFGRYLEYPAGMHWMVHDLPSLVDAGRALANARDTDGKLFFTDARQDADGFQVLLCAGVLQFLDYSLPELLGSLKAPPRHVLVNMTPLHPTRSYATLQRVTFNGKGIANCPYRVTAVKDFVEEFERLGYEAVDHWESKERYMRIPFDPEYSIDRYHGFYFRRA